MTTIPTVGIFLTEDERRHLTRLCDELEALEESALRRQEGPEAEARAAERAALRKLIHLPAGSAREATIRMLYLSWKRLAQNCWSSS